MIGIVLQMDAERLNYLETPFCVEKRNIKKTAILQTKYDWNSTPDRRRTLEQSRTSTGRKASSSYEGGPDFGLGDGPGRWSGMHALPRPVKKYKLPRPEGSPGR